MEPSKTPISDAMKDALAQDAARQQALLRQLDAALVALTKVWIMTRLVDTVLANSGGLTDDDLQEAAKRARQIVVASGLQAVQQP